MKTLKTEIYVILMFYMLLVGGLALIWHYIYEVGLTPEAYSVNRSYPITILIAPLANTTDDLVNSSAILLMLVLFLFCLLYFSPELRRRRGFISFVCVAPLAAGIVASAIEYFIVLRSTMQYDGAGSSIVVTAMYGMTMIISVQVFHSIIKRDVVSKVVSMVISLVFLITFYFGFWLEGNAGAHFWGFFVGGLGTYLYLFHSSDGSDSKKQER